MSLFAKKSISSLIAESSATDGLKKTLSARSLVALGIGAIIGAGLFSITGVAAANMAGPGIMISFIIAAVGCAFAGLCYAEFASMIPVAGSAYTYSYATMGEFIAWIIGWDLVLEYAVGAATVASSWSGYLNELLKSFDIALPHMLTATPFDTVPGILNLPAVFIVVIISMILIRGTSESAWVNAIIVVVKVSIVVIFIALGIHYVQPANLTPLVPQNTGEFGHFGWSGVVRAAAVVFFAYIGFDAVSTAAQETKNPKKAMPIGILGSLVICTVLYIAFAYVMTGVAHYTMFNTGGSSDLAPVAIAIKQMGTVGAGGVVTPAYPWLNTLIIVAILLGYSSVILVMLLGQSRVFYSMSNDGLLPGIFSKLHPRHKTPYKSNLLFMLFVSLFAAFIPGRIVGEMTSIGTLFAFILVCIGVLVMRSKMKDAPRAFRTPFVPLVPILGVLVCLFMMVFLPLDTWIRLIAWMMIGLDIYLSRGILKSNLNAADSQKDHSRSYKITAISGLVLTLVLAILGLCHHFNTKGSDEGLVIFSLIMVVFHLIYYGVYMAKAAGLRNKEG
ncbi:amino acid/polyamine/organocation transporter, APC superfamily [Arachidicoccus rhizosphaerae]|jgi:APA family basic amino acid/polyamine antiporter|uniref:Amino acid/polyamine/organocation transporter, APC superfamily n=1 Tax=Arachidicoccus rhizosphaerae TaxID=551991 RepID=A0A1H3WYQ5_9BACT|nr:amino acid permease [Arachidicoccus rhizosphaerae]SDZ91524.1 amino acid/polyamine/organocation transporter, APC superfamily [Arachidicoccus rhizosphaerae]